MDRTDPIIARAEIQQMQAGVRAWVPRVASDGSRGLRKIAPPALLSLLCAAAFSPLVAAGAGFTGAIGVAGIGVLSSVGGGVLSEVITSALDRLRQSDKKSKPSPAEIEEQIAHHIGQALAAENEMSWALRAEIAAVLAEIDASGTVLRAAVETGNEQVRSDVIAALGALATSFAELSFMIGDLAQAAGQIQRTLDQQSAHVRVIIDQNAKQSAEIRLAREQLAIIESRSRAGRPNDGPDTDPVPRWAGGSPYRGLLSFSEAEADVFYGRERLTTELAVNLAQRRGRGGLVVVTGASGAGKSSLLRAGLLPALARGVQVEGSQHWAQVTMTPTRHPLIELGTRLALLGGTQPAIVRDRLAKHPDQAHLIVWQAVLADAARRNNDHQLIVDQARLVLIVDQFEQVFTLNTDTKGETERQAFIAALCAASANPAGPDDQPPAVVLIAVRGDFFDRCADYPEFRHALQEGAFVVGPMRESELRRTITGPADAAGLQVDAALTGTILSDLRATEEKEAGGALPLLSQVMLLTWKKREGDRLTVRGYGQAGGVSLAVQTSADGVYEALPAKQQALARRIMRSMTVASRDGRLTRRPITWDEVHTGHPDATNSEIHSVLEAFATERLVMLDESTVQITHDALLTAWPRLRVWLEDDQANWVLYSQLAEHAKAWHDNDDDPSFLYRGSQLAAAQQASNAWTASPARYPSLTGIQRDFLYSSRRAAARGRRVRKVLITSLIALLLISITGAGLAIAATRSANQQRNLAISNQLAAQSEEVGYSNPAMESLLAAAAWQIAPTAQARESMLNVLAQRGRAVFQSRARAGVNRTVAFSPDGRLLATGSTDGIVRLWNVATHRQISRAINIHRTDDVTAIAFSPDGRLLATASLCGGARLWSVATHRQIGPALSAARGTCGGSMTALAFSHDGRLLATAGDAVYVWNVANRRKVGVMMNASGVTGVAFSPDGSLVATADRDGRARLWNVATQRQIGSEITAATARSGGLNAIAFSPDGRLLATAGEDGKAKLWDATTHRQIGPTMPASATGEVTFDPTVFGGVTGVAFSPNGMILATAGEDGTARLWNVATKRQIGPAINASSVNILGGVTGVAFSPDGMLLATTGEDGTALWDAAIYSPVGPAFKATDNGGVGWSAFSPDGRLLAVGYDDGKTRLWNMATHQQIGVPMNVGGSHFVTWTGFTPNGKLLAIEYDGDTIQIWDVATHRQIGPEIKAAGSGTDISGITFSPNGRILATASTGGVRLWSVATHRQIGPEIKAAGSGTDVFAVTFSPNGRILATSEDNGIVRLWNTATRRQIGVSIDASGTATIIGLEFSPDGSLLATSGSDGTVRLWNVATHQPVGAPMNGSTTGGVGLVVFGDDGALIATAGDDGTARLWDVATQREIGPPMNVTFPYNGGIGGLTEVAFSPDSRLLATASADGQALLWNVAFPHNLAREMCSIATNVLTQREWDAYAPSEAYQPVCSSRRN